MENKTLKIMSQISDLILPFQFLIQKQVDSALIKFNKEHNTKYAGAYYKQPFIYSNKTAKKYEGFISSNYWEEIVKLFSPIYAQQRKLEQDSLFLSNILQKNSMICKGKCVCPLLIDNSIIQVSEDILQSDKYRSFKSCVYEKISKAELDKFNECLAFYIPLRVLQ